MSADRDDWDYEGSGSALVVPAGRDADWGDGGEHNRDGLQGKVAPIRARQTIPRQDWNYDRDGNELAEISAKDTHVAHPSVNAGLHAADDAAVVARIEAFASDWPSYDSVGELHEIMDRDAYEWARTEAVDLMTMMTLSELNHLDRGLERCSPVVVLGLITGLARRADDYYEVRSYRRVFHLADEVIDAYGGTAEDHASLYALWENNVPDWAKQLQAD